ncbi:MAG: ParB/RepB/Spo0J family partition protein [Planctomycetes bacterium]|nr:ParB/RepB/Spo0J family partition protein [Planctomycetota bacterium]
MARAVIDNPLFKKTETGDFGAMQLPLTAIQPSPHQTRQSFSDDAIAELASSINTIGLLQPIKVAKLGETYQLVYGERRLRALKTLGMKELIWDSRTQLACIPEKEGADAAVQTLTENILRENLSAIEEADAYVHIKTRRGFNKQQQLADYMGIDKRRISEKLKLLELSDAIKNELINKAGLVTASHARELMKLESEELQLEVLMRVADQHLSVKETARLVNDLRRKAQDLDALDRTEFRLRIEQKKIIRRFEQLCRQLIRAADVVETADGRLKTAFLDAFAGGDSVVAQLEEKLRAMRLGSNTTEEETE